MKQLTGNQVRQMFLDFFKSKGHMIEPGASLIPHNDPTLLWINAGVAALKKYFDGTEKPACNRIANAQKSIRTNDIENVGKTARHHTFFEMLGNFSIGDYFKEEAIPFAWEFLTSPEWIGFDKEKLYKNMVDARADWLYELPQWEKIFDENTRKRLYKEQKNSGTIRKEKKIARVVNTVKIGRNDPCPCGSGKKYKKCCGRNA